MRYLVFLAIAVVLGVLALFAFANANPARLAAGIKRSAGLLALVVAGVLIITGRWVMALPLLAFGGMLLSGRGVGGFSPVGSGREVPEEERYSTVRSAMLEMWLNHETGAMAGKVLAGQFEGLELDQMADTDIWSLHGDVVRDPESLALFEAYIDRRSPGWREHVDEDSGAGHRGPAHSGPMTNEEAYEVLGLAQGASTDDIRAAHRRLMKRLHPDRGGSDFLAAKINEAKDWLLRKHGSSNTHY